MATRAANKRLTREFQTIQQNPPPYIVAHPSETNILEWHYIITGPPNTPYENGQYWGTLLFPPTYPFAPPAIRMHTPSGRFQPSTRLCLSISDFHPKSFNPAWEVSTILIGLLSFMTSDEMTTGSVHATDAERRWAAARTRWWNSTGGGTHARPVSGVSSSTRGIGAVKAGDGGVKFTAEWPDVHRENWAWMKENRIDDVTGQLMPEVGPPEAKCSAEVAALRRGPSGSGVVGAVVGGGQAAKEAGQGWSTKGEGISGSRNLPYPAEAAFTNISHDNGQQNEISMMYKVPRQHQPRPTFTFCGFFSGNEGGVSSARWLKRLEWELEPYEPRDQSQPSYQRNFLRSVDLLLTEDAATWADTSEEISSLLSMTHPNVQDVIKFKDLFQARFPNESVEPVSAAAGFNAELRDLCQMNDESLWDYYQRAEAMMHRIGATDRVSDGRPLTILESSMLDLIIRAFVNGTKNHDVYLACIPHLDNPRLSFRDIYDIGQDVATNQEWESESRENNKDWPSNDDRHLKRPNRSRDVTPSTTRCHGENTPASNADTSYSHGSNRAQPRRGRQESSHLHW